MSTQVQCNKCKVYKETTAFAPSRLKRGIPWCRECTNALRSTPEQRARRTKQTQDWRRANGAVPRKQRLVDEYGQECAQCDSYQTWGCFYDDKSNNKTGKRATCKKCVIEKQIDRLLRKNFGIGVDDYQFMLSEQGGMCFLCQELETKVSFNSTQSNRLAVDHWHECSEGHVPERGCKSCIRGLLCTNCNLMMANVDKKPKLQLLFLTYVARRPLLNRT